MSVATLQALVTAAQTAIASEDWTTAENKLLQAHAELVAMPNATSNMMALVWRQNQVNELLKLVTAKKTEASVNAVGGPQFTRLKAIGLRNG